MNKIIIEVGSTVTKVYKYDGENIEELDLITIEFKKNYSINNILDKNDVDMLINKIHEYKNITENIYVCGTSIFRNLDNSQKEKFLVGFKEKTGIHFNIISQEDESELTVYGCTRNVNQQVTVFIGGGGSTEITTYNNEIKEMVNSPVGVIDIMQQFPDLADDLATTDIETVKKFIKKRLNLPSQKSDILILAGGNHKLFALNSGISYENNDLYDDRLQPIKMNIESRKLDTEKYYKSISLDEIRSRTKDPKWWYATRAMCAFVLVVAEEIGAKYIVPTDIGMIYGLINNT